MGQAQCPNRRTFHLRIEIALGPESEPAPSHRPATAQEGTAADLAVVESDSDGWEALPIGATPFQGSTALPGGIPRFVLSAALIEPVECLPSLQDLFHPRVRVYAVWFVPNQPTWRGIHYGEGNLPWRQIRSWACAAFPLLRPEAVFSLIKWQRCWDCSHDQLIRVLHRESQSSAAYSWFRWAR